MIKDIRDLLKENNLECDAINESVLEQSSASSIKFETGTNEGYYITLVQNNHEITIRIHNYEIAKNVVTLLIPNFMPCNW